MQSDLLEQLRTLARSPILLVACDYDGTLAEIVEDPAKAMPNESALRALRACAQILWTRTAIVSGRSFKDLVGFIGTGGSEFKVGSHGAEWQRAGLELSASQSELLRELGSMATAIAAGHSDIHCELKPAGVALHFRAADPKVADQAMAAALAQCGRLPGVFVKHGRQVVEFLVVDANKGVAVGKVKHAVGATGVFFIGDDLTDEDVFKTLRPHDVAVRVGAGESAAQHRVDGVPDVASVLEALAQLRSEWAAARRLIPLEQCGLLSDQRTAAIVTPGARIAWLCLPRLDSSALFAELLGDESSGGFDISPVEGGAPTKCSYDGDTFLFVTEWQDMRVTDYLDCSGGRAFQRAGRADLIRVIEGAGRARIRFAPRLDYGRTATRFRVREEGLELEGSTDPICLRSPGVEWTIVDTDVHQTAEAVVDLSNGPITLELRYGSANLSPNLPAEPERRELNRRFWAGWPTTLALPSTHRDLVKRSALVLKALCYGPSGALAAAATTSLPEQIGGIRNWDYRYCWPRDAAIAAASLVRLGNTGHALKFLDWMLGVVDTCETPERLQPIYTLAGGHLQPEAELGHLAGFGGSSPVRISNAAANQVQLDVFGPVVNLVAMLAERGAPIAPDHWRLVRAMVRAIESRWVDPDHGIWEMRIERRHHVHSKVMCWHTVDRALVVESAVYGTQDSNWLALRTAIREDVLLRGWNEQLRAFVGAYDHRYADAGVLCAGLAGLLARDDPRWTATIDFVAHELLDGPTVRRYRTDDGLAGDEGGMHLCTGWLIESWLSIGKIRDATDLLEQFARLMHGPGILTEQHEPRAGLAVGNLAQAYSHAAFINAATALDQFDRAAPTSGT